MHKILIIDDEKATLSMFRLFLKAYGYTVFIAENGAEGIEVLKKEKPSIVFTDLKMPGMDGFEVLKRIKEIEPATEVVVMTGHGDMDLAVQALNFEATDFINKPIQRTAFDSALRRAEERLRQSSPLENQVFFRKAEDVTIMDIKGNVTSHSEDILTDSYENISKQGADRILMHFDENSSINGAGIAILIQMLSECKKKNQAVAITGLSENFKKIFDMVGITSLAKIFDSEDNALAEIGNWKE
ncbi:MAG: response regulator [Desulfobacterales bacterium]|nr:response regulator [Desulfobacterales bacterium]